MGKQIYNNISISINYLRGNPWRMGLIFIFPFIALALPVAFIPLRYSFSTVIFFSSILPTSIMYVSIAFVWRNGTLYDLSKTTRNNKYIFYVSIFLFMTIACFVLLFFTLTVLSIFSWLDILLHGYVWAKESSLMYNTYLIWKIDFAALIYAVIEAMIITFSICGFIQVITKETVVIYNILIALMILTILFGGGFNFFFNDSSVIIVEDGRPTQKSLFTADDAFFPKSTYWFNIFFPYFAPGQHLSNLGSSMIYLDSSHLEGVSEMILNPNGVDGLVPRYDNQFWTWQKNDLTYYSIFNEEFVEISWLDTWMWNSLWFQTYIWAAGLWLMTFALTHFKKNNY